MKRTSKILAFALSGTLAAGTIAWSAFAADGQSVRQLVNALLGKSSFQSGMDVNKDGKVNAVDLALMKKDVLNPGSPASSSIQDFGTKPHSNVTMFEDFRDGSSQYFIASDGWENGDPFDCGWYKNNTSLQNGCLTLTIDKDYSGKYNYSGAEYRTNDFYSYGYYETSMQAIKNDGVVSSFFTYTGPSDNNPWDEIDIEVLGKDTTKVQFNYYTNGKGEHEYMYNLGFDASQGYHTYGFDWQPNYIAWYVDGKEVYRATDNIPKTAGKIMMNTWPGRGVNEWLNAFNGKTPLTARYQWVTYEKSSNNQQQGDNNQQGDNHQQQGGSITDYGTQPDTSATMYDNFRNGSSKYFIASDGWENGDPFDCGWYKQNTAFKDGALTLTIDKDYSGKYNYSGAEYRTNDFYSYGYYETSMQAIKNDGVVSSFFTYTGPSDNNPWDEIDIEVLGKDTTKVQFNYYTNGKGEHEYMYNLGFDASQGYHTYGFDWQPNYIAWYVDGKEVYRATDNIPKTAGKIMMNTWPGRGVNEWLNAFNGKTPLTARYQWVTYNKNGKSGNQQQGGNNDNPWGGNNNNPWGGNQQQGGNNTSTDTMNKNATMVEDFRDGSSRYFIASDGWTNGNPFNCGWYKNNTSLNNGCLSLTIDTDYSGKYAYSAAEYRTNDFYSFGYYETSMQAIKNDGVVSSFFTYTGESDNNPWDEIDIEVLGKDTTKVQFNYYTNGKGNHEYMYDLGFDASQGFHRYGFDWQRDHITWYVDGKAVYTAYSEIPTTAGKIMMNVWPGIGVDDWLKAFNGKTPLTAKYEWVTYNKQ